ncbi:hypothetical protein KEM60_02168 [Austwickia sp. TVS 96-490-7B]|uniref:S1 family peptidase n=1 Tax=Austwickia sp. TVS 96-490-7B TaxID=2830843 RepID=UPI001C5993FC|nr:serine protease [Austwickia sp. TVS 96-490-7B]MBW3085957.1 hypothetical protein [Austwickia sp. TVS 96-490-7B]
MSSTMKVGRPLSALAAVAMIGACLIPSAQASAKPGDVVDKPDIIGGVAASSDEFPFMTSLQYDNQHFCGGSLVNPRVIMTAAHCVSDLVPSMRGKVKPHGAKIVTFPLAGKAAAKPTTPTTTAPKPTATAPKPTATAPKPKEDDSPARKVSLVIGRTTLSDKTQGVERAIQFRGDEPMIQVHPKYGQGSGYDIALVILDKPVEQVVPVSLPTTGTDSLLTPGENATVSGWGNTDVVLPSFPDRLRKVNVPILAMNECQIAGNGNFNAATDFCAGKQGKDSCQGDSGGPIMRKVPGRDEYYQIGVVSWGFGCAGQGAPGFYTSVGSQELWNTFDGNVLKR